MHGGGNINAAGSSSAPELRIPSVGNRGKEARCPPDQSEGSKVSARADADSQLLQAQPRKQELESRCRHLEQRCSQLEGVVNKDNIVSIRSALLELFAFDNDFAKR